MTREEQIEKAVSEVLEERQTAVGRKKYGGWYFVNWFKEGVKWADEHPKSQWISVNDDLPCKHSQLLENINYTQSVLVVLSWNDDPTKKHIETAHMCNKIGSFDVNWYWENRAHYHVTHWMPIPNLN